MLAPNLKSPADLKITKQGHAALIQVLGMLERGELIFVPKGARRIPNGFNMQTIWDEEECGSVGCIKGWCQQVAQDEKLFGGELGLGPRALNELFMYCDCRRGTVTVDQAACALRNYLALGEACWDEVLA